MVMVTSTENMIYALVNSDMVTPKSNGICQKITNKCKIYCLSNNKEQAESNYTKSNWATANNQIGTMDFKK